MMAKYKSARDKSLLCAPKGFVEEANKSFISSNGRTSGAAGVEEGNRRARVA